MQGLWLLFLPFLCYIAVNRYIHASVEGGDRWLLSLTPPNDLLLVDFL